MKGLFDLNIEQVLENWSIADALREIIANALDEQVLSKTRPIEIIKDGDVWHIRDFGRGIQYIHFTQNENDEKLQSGKLIGKFGVGLKDALAVLHRHNCKVLIESCHSSVTTKMALKSGFDVQTLHAEFRETSNPNMVGTDFAVTGISDADMEDAKKRFLVFNDLTKLESTRYGDVYACRNDDPAIYINGVKVAQESNFMFSYNITALNAQIRKALNRERSNVGRTAYSDTVKNILKSCKSNDVLLPLVDDLQHRMYGTNKDETAWVDVAAQASQTLNKAGEVVFMTPTQRAELTNQQVEILERSGKRLVMVTDDVYSKIRDTVETFDNIYDDYNDSFQYQFIKYHDLSKSEKRVFDLKDKIIDLLEPTFKICRNIKVSETIRVDYYGGSTLGAHEGDSIIIKRSVLSSPEGFCCVLAHELCHHQHNYEDNSRDFENDLTNMLGHILYKMIACPIPDDHIDEKKHPLFVARRLLRKISSSWRRSTGRS